MKKTLSIFILLVMLISNVCSAAEWVYPEHSGFNGNGAEITERINIVFDNSGHEYVKNMLIDSLLSASVCEKADIWLYPIAGSNDPIKLEPTKEFIEANFNVYSKSLFLGRIFMLN